MNEDQVPRIVGPLFIGPPDNTPADFAGVQPVCPTCGASVGPASGATVSGATVTIICGCGHRLTAFPAPANGRSQS